MHVNVKCPTIRTRTRIKTATHKALGQHKHSARFVDPHRVFEHACGGTPESNRDEKHEQGRLEMTRGWAEMKELAGTGKRLAPHQSATTTQSNPTECHV